MRAPGRQLDGLTWTTVAPISAATVLAVPIGATEQHGPHLPLGTDTAVAVELAGRWADRRGDVVVAPALAYGSSGEHRGFPGTISIGQEALEAVLVELGRSADEWAAVAFISAHGGNAAPLRRAVGRLAGEGRSVRAWSPSIPGGDAHAGRTETSMALAIDPAAVAMDRAAPGALRPIGVLLDDLRIVGVAGVSANGVLGDPTGATDTEGRALLAKLTDDLTAAFAGWPEAQP